MHGRQCLVALALRQGGKVDVQSVFAVFLRRRQLGRIVHDLGDVHGGLLRHAGDGVQRLQPQLCHQAEPGNGAVGGEIVGVHVAVWPEMAHHHAAHLQHDGGPQRRPLQVGAVGDGGENHSAPDQQRRKGHQRQQYEGNPLQNHLYHGAEKAVQHVACHGLHVAKAEIGLKVALTAVFDAFKYRPGKGEHGGDYRLYRLLPNQIQPQGQHEARGQCKCGDGQQGGGEEGVLLIKNLQKPLVVHQCAGQEEQRQHSGSLGGGLGVQPGFRRVRHNVSPYRKPRQRRKIGTAAIVNHILAL